MPDPRVRGLLSSVGIADRLLVRPSAEAGIAEARRMVADVERREARTFTTRALLGWRRPRLIGTTTLVVSELVTESVTHASTVVDLTLSHAPTTVRVAVHDRGGGRPCPRNNGWEDETLTGRGMLLMERMATCWGLFPGRHTGKTVWALFEAA